MEKRKASNGEGTVVQRKDGRFQASFYVPDEYGIKKRKCVYGKTEEAAREKMNDILKKVEDDGAWIQDPEEKFNQLKYNKWLDQWLNDCKPQAVKVSTLENYERLLKNHVRPAIGEKLIRQITKMDIQKLITNLGKTMKPGTVEIIHRVIYNSMVHAMDHGILKENPASRVNKAKITRNTKFLKEEELALLLSEMKKRSKHYTATYLTATTGMRRGEILGLEWRHVDFENNTIRVEQALTETKAEGIKLGPPKTEQAKRIIGVASHVMSELKKHAWKQQEYKNILGEAYFQEHDLVFCKEDGTPYCPRIFSNNFSDMAKSIGVDITFHGLRHTAATMLLEDGLNLKYLSTHLGHSDIKVTQFYTHITDKVAEESSSIMERRIEKRKTV